MNYEKIILELLDRIKTLEERVAVLEARNQDSSEKVNLTAKARDYILQQKQLARQAGRNEVILVCNDIQKAIGVTNRAPAVCSAMYACMAAVDEVLSAPPSGKSTTVRIRYYVR